MIKPRLWIGIALGLSTVGSVTGCALFQIVPALLTVPTEIQGCPQMVAPQVGDAIQLSYVSTDAAGGLVVNTTWSAVGAAMIADTQANPAMVTFTGTGSVTIQASSTGLIAPATCLTLVSAAP